MSTLNPLLPQPRLVDAGAPFRWIKLGFDDLRACPGPSLFYGVCFAAMGFVFFFALRDRPHYFAAVTAGFMLLGPALAIGLYDLSRRRERHEPCALHPSLTVWRTNLANLALFSLLLIVIYLLWSRASLVTFALFFSGALPDLRTLLLQLLQGDNLAFLLIWLAVGGLFAALVFAISIVSIPLMLDRQVDAITAALTSLRVLARNPGAMAMWAAIIAWLGAASLLMWLVGIVVAGPLLGHASWHAYRELIEPAGEIPEVDAGDTLSGLA